MSLNRKLRLNDIKAIKEYAQIVIEKDTKKLNKDDWQRIGAKITINEKLQVAIARRIIMGNLETANKTIASLLLANGIKPERALNLYKESEKIARSKENSGDLIKIADRYTTLLDMLPQKVQYSETRRTTPDYEGLLPSKETVTKTVSTTVSGENKQKEENDKK